MKVAFYCVCDERYFLGAVGMINSLRLLGHREPVFVLDCGMAPEQRELIASEATAVAAPADAPSPYLLKTIAPLAHPADVAVLIDTDMIVTRPLCDLVERASGGRVVAVEDETDRFVPEWGEILGLGTARRRPYVSSSLVLLGGELGRTVLELLDDRQREVDFELTFYGRDLPDYPFRYPEQDVLNAILCTRPNADRVVALDTGLVATPPFEGLRVVHEGSLRCAYEDGVEPYVLHHYARKPWLEPMYHGVYSRLLARLLLGPDVALRVPEREVPLRMRGGARSRVARARVDAQGRLGGRLRTMLPSSIVSRIDEFRHKRATRAR